MTRCHMLLTILFMLAIPAETVAQGVSSWPSSVPPITGKDDDFVVILNWMTAAEPQARDAFVQEATSMLGGRSEPEAQAQLAFLRQLAKEDKEEHTKVIKGYAAIADAPETPPAYAATAVFRCAELLEQNGNIARATTALAITRRRNPGGYLWLKRDGVWQQNSVDVVTEHEFLRLNADRLTYRATAWLAKHTPLTGPLRPLIILLLFCVMIRVVELPLIVRALRQVDRSFADQSVLWRYIRHYPK